MTGNDMLLQLMGSPQGADVCVRDREGNDSITTRVRVENGNGLPYQPGVDGKAVIVIEANYDE